MIDLFALGLTHFLLAVAAWRLLTRDDLEPPARRGRHRRDARAQPREAARETEDGHG